MLGYGGNFLPELSTWTQRLGQVDRPNLGEGEIGPKVTPRVTSVNVIISPYEAMVLLPTSRLLARLVHGESGGRD